MGKKRVIKKSEEELLQEKQKVDEKFQKSVAVSKSKTLRKGRIYISSSYNNTIISLTDSQGNVLAWQSAGSIGFKGTKKGTSFAGSKVAQAINQIMEKLKIRQVDVIVKGIGAGRDTALQTLAAGGVDFLSIRDVTPIPHNGCRPPKPRRL